MKILFIPSNLIKNKFESVNCFKFLTSCLVDEFEKMGVECCSVQSVRYDKKTNSLYYNWEDFPTDIDATIYSACSFKNDFKKIKELTKKPLFSLLDVPMQGVDWAFYFAGSNKNVEPNTTLISCPVHKQMCKNIPKKKKIIIDHYLKPDRDIWGINSITKTKEKTDLTYEISEWLTELKDEYEIIRKTGFNKINKAVFFEKDTIKPHEKILFKCSMEKYLKETDDADVYIATHYESCGYEIPEAAARGIRVFAPKNFLCPDFVEKLGIKTFKNKEELIKLIKTPRENYWNNNINNCTDYSEVAKIIINKIKELNR